MYDGVREVEGNQDDHPAQSYEKSLYERTLAHLAQVEDGRAENERR
jgi:hypothetical protein